MQPYMRHLQAPVPQSEPLPGQVPNSAGGHAYPVDDWKRLDRFLILGSEGGSYYASERKLTLENLDAVKRCIAVDGARTVMRIVEVSDSGRAPKNDPALLALAYAAKKGDLHTRTMAFQALPSVARIGTHLFHFAAYIQALGGWGRGTKRAIARWYLEREPANLALQVTKYQQRDGWSHRDLLRLAHPKTTSELHKTVFDWVCRGWTSVGEQPHPDAILRRIWAHERAKGLTKPTDRKELIRLIADHALPHESVPNEAKGDPAVWEAMLPAMGITALIRNLAKMTSVGLIAPLSSASSTIRERLLDLAGLKRGRVHPLQLLTALLTYRQGHGQKGSLAWCPEAQVIEALDQAFYLAFKAIEPTHKRHLLALDCSASMDGGAVAGIVGLSPRLAAAAMSLVTANVEPQHHFVGFSTQIVNLSITARQSLHDAIRVMQSIPFGGTDCAAPMRWALANKVPVDTFIIYTDSETWAGSEHPRVSLEVYRQRMGIPAKMIVVGMVSNGFSIADPNDGGQMDVVGFDTDAPALMSDFVRS